MSARSPLLRPLLRPFLSAPALSLAIATTFALGVGVSTALFAYLSFFLFPTFAAPAPERLAQVNVGTTKEPEALTSVAELRALAGSGAFELLTATLPMGATVADRGVAQHAWGRAVTPDFFALFGARAVAGRMLTASDETPGAPSVVVLGHRLWRELFAADPGVLGRTVALDGHSFTVVGVVARGFQGLGFASEYFVPLVHSDRLNGMQRYAVENDKWLVLWARLAQRDRAGDLARARAALVRC